PPGARQTVEHAQSVDRPTGTGISPARVMVMWPLVAAAGAVLLADQLTKAAAVRWLPETGAASRRVRLRRVDNPRPRFARAVGARALLGWLVPTAGAVTLAGMVRSNLGHVGIGLVVGGAAGNLLDWLRSGRVVDFVDLRWWPVFNVADVGIVVGIAA